MLPQNVKSWSSTKVKFSAYAESEMKSTRHSAKQNFTAKQFHAALAAFHPSEGRISLKKAAFRLLFLKVVTYFDTKCTPLG